MDAFRGVLTYERVCLRLQKQEIAWLTLAAELVKRGVVAEVGRVVPTGLSFQRAGQARLCPVFRQPAVQENTPSDIRSTRVNSHQSVVTVGQSHLPVDIPSSWQLVHFIARKVSVE